MGHIGEHVTLDDPAFIHESAWLYGKVYVGPGASNSISIWLQMEVSSYDSFTTSGTFQIESAIPGPAALAVFAVFGVSTRRRRG